MHISIGMTYLGRRTAIQKKKIVRSFRVALIAYHVVHVCVGHPG